jgi:hypothetical protein
MSRTYLPAAIGQTAVDVLATVARTTDSRLAKNLFAVCERRCAPLVGSLPCRASLFFQATEGAYGAPERILSELSLTPLYLRGMCSAMQRRAVEQLVDGTHFRTCIPRLQPFIECGNRYGLQCPECARLAHETYGRRISYCCHCISFVTRCPLHECELYSDDECSSLESLLSVRHETCAVRNALRYARVAHALAFDCPHEPVRAALSRRLQDKGFITEPRRFRVAELRDAFNKLFSGGFEDVRLNELIRREDIVQNCVRALTRDERAMHPVFLVLMDWLSTELDGVKVPRSPGSRRAAARAEGTTTLPEDVRCKPEPELMRAKRAEWTQHRELCSGMTRTQMRHSLPGTWRWLYCNDRDWLTRNQSPCQRPGSKKVPAKIPPSVAEAIRSNERDLRCSNTGLPPLPSAYQTRLAYGMSDYVFKRAADAFNGVGNKAALPALKQAFVTRRVEASIVALAATGTPLDIATVARRARLRISTVKRYRRPS